jgi:serine protease Do
MDKFWLPPRLVMPAVTLLLTSALASCSMLSDSSKTTVTQTVTQTPPSPTLQGSSSATASASPPVTPQASSPAAPQATSEASSQTTESGPKPWSEVFQDTASGVVRLDVLGCDGSGGTGTGFLVSNSLIATVAHVVDGYRTVRVTSPQTGLVTAGTVVGFDKSHDLALVRTDNPLPGHIFELEAEQPPLGTEIGVVGFPLGRSMQITTGNISATHDHRFVQGGYELSDMLLTDAAANPGNSGGPWLTAEEKVVALDESGPPYEQGLPAQGNNAGVAGADAASHIEAWKISPQPLQPCGAPPDRMDAALTTLDFYFYYINQSDYASAYAQLDSSNHPISDLTKFIDGVKTSQDFAPGSDPGSWPHFQLVNEYRSNGAIFAEVRFRSHQESHYGPGGLSCVDWHLIYEFVAGAGVEAIHTSAPMPNHPAYQACDPTSANGSL